jgi:hypothetical protein
MKKAISTLVGTCLLALGWNAPLQADHHMVSDPAGQIELYTCKYVKNADRGDLDRVIDKYRKWADKNDDKYTAWLLTPNFANPDIDWDIGWMGAWPDGNTMGAGLDTWREKGLQADFDKVLSCNMHIAAASVNIKPPKNETSPESVVVSFRSCTVAEDASFDDAFAGTQEMAKFMGSKGSSAGAWMFFPTMGSGKVEFDYFFVLGYENYKALGHDQEVIANGGGWQKSEELLGGKTSCDVPRVYSAELVRNPS